MKDALKKYIKKKIVLDTNSAWIYIGVLDKVLENCVVLSDVDIHDSKETLTSKERYVLDSKKTGVKTNRHKIFVSLDYVVSFSLLDDVKSF